MAISHSPVLIAVWVAGWMSAWEVVQIIQLLGESVHASANTMLARDDNCFWASCSVDRLPPPASSFPIHSKAEASAAFTGNQAKSSNKGVFTPFLRSAKWISVLLYFKISHFLQKLTQHILLARKMWRRRWEVRRLSQHGSPFRIYFKVYPLPSNPHHISTLACSNMASAECAAWPHVQHFRSITQPPFPPQAPLWTSSSCDL